MRQNKHFFLAKATQLQMKQIWTSFADISDTVVLAKENQNRFSDKEKSILTTFFLDSSVLTVQFSPFCFLSVLKFPFLFAIVFSNLASKGEGSFVKTYLGSSLSFLSLAMAFLLSSDSLLLPPASVPVKDRPAITTQYSQHGKTQSLLLLH